MKKKVKLFFILPIYGCNKTSRKTRITVLGIPVYKRKSNENETKTHYSFFGIPVLKIKKG